MVEQDTVRLLRQCDAGVKMGISSIDDVLESVSSKQLYTLLKTCKAQHEKLREEIEAALSRFHDEGKEPNPIAQTMSTLKTGMKLAMKDSDKTIADLMLDGCDMGVKSLYKYMNHSLS